MVNLAPGGGTTCIGATGATGTAYSYAQLEGLWINAGGSRATAPIAAAIAMAESAGCSAAVNANDSNGQGGTQSSWGLWQISNGTHAQPVPNILSPATNAQQAVAKYNASGWTPWGTYTSGAYKAFLSGKTSPDTGVPGVSVPTTTQTTAPTTTQTCVVQLPKIGLGPLSVGGQCMFSKTEARALIGALILAAGGLTLTTALAIAVLGAFRRSPAGRAAGAVLSAVPSPVSKAAGRAVGGKPRTRNLRMGQLTADERRDESTARQVESRTRDSAKGPALRDDDRPRARQLANPRVSERQSRELVPF